MSDSTFSIHIGLPKTATTTLQDSLYSNTSSLLRQSKVAYMADLCRVGYAKATGHHFLAWNLFVPRHPHRAEVDHGQVRHRISLTENALMSSEWFAYATARGVNDLVERWALPEKRQVIIVIRQCSSHAQSSWMQDVKMGFTMHDYETYVVNNYLPRYKGPLKQLLPWVENGFYPIVISYEAMIASGVDVDRYFIESVYGISIVVNNWRRIRSSSNVSPDTNTLDKFRRIAIQFSRYQAGQEEVSGNHHLLHDKVCKIIEKQDQVSPDTDALDKFRRIAIQFNRYHAGEREISGDQTLLRNEVCKIIEKQDQREAVQLSSKVRESLADLEAEDLSELHRLQDIGRLVGFSL